MSSLAQTRHRNRGGGIYRVIANAMILLGLIALPFIVLRGISEANIYNSPFDVVDGPEGSEKGFLPLVIEIDNEQGIVRAPTLSAEDIEAGTVVDEAKIAEVMGALQPQLDDRNGKVLIPTRIVIPSINVDAIILLADYKEVPFWGKTYKQWMAPNANAVGWHFDSATLGRPGNTVLNGHHNVYGEVFRYLGDLEQGAIIYLYAGELVFSYVVGRVEILPEKYQPLETRLENARWTLPSEDERITVISCWPYEGNSSRVVVVAVPIELDAPAP